MRDDTNASAPLVKEYLRTHSLADLFRDHAVKASVGTRNYKASFNYDQLQARDSDPLACQCRGLILAKADGSPFPQVGVVGDTIVLARPMDRFFNHGSGAAHPLDLSSRETIVWEKLDGSLLILYKDSVCDEWCVATRAVPDANVPIDGFGRQTFRSLFELALSAQGTNFAELTRHYVCDGITYCFELTSPFNRVVVDHAAASVTLIAMRDTHTGEEFDPTVFIEFLEAFPVQVVHRHLVSDIDELHALVSKRPATESEGVVVCMPGFRRVKIKSAAYVAASRLTEACGASPRALLTVILSEQQDDVFPLLRKHLREAGEVMARRLAALCKTYDQAYEHLAEKFSTDPNRRKAMALGAQDAGLWMAVVMDRFSGKSDSMASFLRRNRRDGKWSDSFLDSVLALIGMQAEDEDAGGGACSS